MSERRDDAEERLLRKLQIVSGVVFLVLIVLMVTVDNFGRLFIDPNFHVSEVLAGTLVGALLALIGVTALRLPKKGE